MKKKNIDSIEKYDHLIIHGIGALVVEWLRDVDLLYLEPMRSLKDSKKKTINIDINCEY